MLGDVLGIIKDIGNALFGPPEGERPSELAAQVEAQRTAPSVYSPAPATAGYAGYAPGVQLVPYSPGSGSGNVLPWVIGGAAVLLVVVAALVIARG